MITTAYVKIWGKLVGAVAWDPEEQLGSFEYDPSFLELKWDLAPIKMPISNGPTIYSFPKLRVTSTEDYDTFKGLPGLLADMLPDKYGNQLLNTWLAQQGRTSESMNPVEQLCFIGSRGMGALEFEPTVFKSRKRSYSIEVDSLVTMSKRMLSKREDFKTNLTAEEEKAMVDILKIGTSAGGARPKAVIAYNEKTGDVKSGQANAPKGYEHWLIKLDGVSDTQLGASTGYGRVEMAYYQMALDCGIAMMESRLLEENGRAHFMTKRYDRSANNTKHHIQTWCGMSHFDFNDIRSFSYEQLFQTMRELGLYYIEAEQMFRRMVFNVLARNCDDHTKNFAFMLEEGGEWKLSPAYDICHAYRPGSYWVSQHTLSINGKRKNITIEDLMIVAKSMNIKKAKSIIQDIDEIVRGWRDYAAMYKVEKAKMKAIQASLISYS